MCKEVTDIRVHRPAVTSYKLCIHSFIHSVEVHVNMCHELWVRRFSRELRRAHRTDVALLVFVHGDVPSEIKVRVKDLAALRTRPLRLTECINKPTTMTSAGSQPTSSTNQPTCNSYNTVCIRNTELYRTYSFFINVVVQQV